MARVARRQYGNVTTGQLHDLGLTGNAIAVRVRGGRLFRVHHGVYAVGRPPNTPPERASAAVLACGPAAALSHLGALALWGFSTAWPAAFEVIVTADRRPRGIATHRIRNLTRTDTRVQLGIRATSPARTMLDCAPRLDGKQRTRTVNDALRSRFLTQDQLADVRRRFPAHPGAALLDPFLDGNPTDSGFEDDFKEFCTRYDLPRPQTNVPVAGHRVDALFAPQRVIVETDGWDFHKDRQAFETDRERDADTLRAGYVTVRITWKRLHGRPDPEAERLRAILTERLPA